LLDQPRKPKFRSTYSPGGGGGGASPSPQPKPTGEVRDRSGASPGSAGPPGPKQPPIDRPPKKESAVAPSRTTMPPRQHIRCFECGYEFNLTGRMHSTYCPKCRTTLDLAGYTIDSDCDEPLKTLGTIRITKRGVVSSSRMVATNIELLGKIKNTPSQAFESLILYPGAQFTRKDVKSADLRIESGAEVTFKNAVIYRNIDIAGTLRGTVYATGLVTLRSSGVFEGTINGRHLSVEEGGLLLGEMNISEDGLKQAEEKREEYKENPPNAYEREKVKVPELPDPDDDENPDT